MAKDGIERLCKLVGKLEGCVHDKDQAGFNKHIKMEIGESESANECAIHQGTMTPSCCEAGPIRSPWVAFFDMLHNTK